MGQRRKARNSMQLEFTVLVQAAEVASQHLADQQTEKRRVAKARKKALCRVSSAGFGKSWLASVTAHISHSPTLREGVVLTSARISELLDLELRVEGYPQHWKEKYDEFCDVQARYYGGLEDESAGCVALIWAGCRDVFRLYYSIHSMSDWDLHETVCSEEGGDSAASNPESAEAQCLQNYSELVASLHFLITDG